MGWRNTARWGRTRGEVSFASAMELFSGVEGGSQWYDEDLERDPRAARPVLAPASYKGMNIGAFGSPMGIGVLRRRQGWGCQGPETGLEACSVGFERVCVC